ncbi:MAG: tetratricopeptide repeat protein [Candidatus Methylomirabilia bacterium]
MGTLLASCAGLQVSPEVDQRTIQAQAEWEARTLEQLQRGYDDPLLDEYLAALVDRLIPPEDRAAGSPRFRFFIVRDPSPNAFALPNGQVYLHTGLLARLDNEAQLATILAHELTHVTHLHMLKALRDARNARTVFGAGMVPAPPVTVIGGAEARRRALAGAGPLSQTEKVLLGLGLTLAYTASVTGYSSDLEREADEESMKRLVKAGYDPKEAPKVFELLGEVRGDGRPIEVFFFGSRPRLTERVETTARLLRTRYISEAADPHRTVNTPDFSHRLRAVVRDNALLELRAARFSTAKAQLDRVLGETPEDPVAHLYYGDLYRLQAQRAGSREDRERLGELARERYEQAAELDPTFADPFRQLGLLFYQLEDLDRAREAFRRYLALNPEAPDARRIEEYLAALER